MRPTPIPAWTMTAPYDRVLAAHRDGRITDDQWQAYRVIWFYSAPRFSDLVSGLPYVSDAWRQIDSHGVSL
jgi:hypothetical protein